MRKLELSDIILTILWAIVAILMVFVFIYEANAQDNPRVVTVFEQGCIEALDGSHYRLRFYYTSDGVEKFTFKMGDAIGSNAETLPYTGRVKTNIPQSFKTSAGLHDKWYVEAKSEDSPYTFNLIFTNDIGSATLPLNTWDNTTWCEVDRYSQAKPVETAQIPIVALNSPIVAAVQVVSTGRTCTVKYPQIILVCAS